MIGMGNKLRQPPTHLDLEVYHQPRCLTNRDVPQVVARLPAASVDCGGVVVMDGRQADDFESPAAVWGLHFYFIAFLLIQQALSNW